MLWVYVLYSPSRDRLYVGHTDNLQLRLARHNEGLVRSTAPYRPWVLIYHESFPSRAAAMKREKELKSGQGQQWILARAVGRTLNRQSPPEAA
jgi:putative endonuclease